MCGSHSRRRFLKAGLSLGGLVLAPQCFAAGEGGRLPRVSLVVLSDTHLGYQGKERAAEQWELTATEVNKVPADLVLHLGDIVDGGREEQYPVYLRTRGKIDKPVHEIPGNHDPAELFEKYIRKPIATVVEHEWLRLLLLGNARRESHDGFLSPAQLAWIEAQSREAKQENRYVALCMHVPAHTNRHPDRGWYIKPEHGQKELYEIVARHQERILCLMHGHFHNGIRGWDDHAPVHEVVFPSALYNKTRRLEEQMAPGYNLPEFRPGFTSLVIERGVMRLRFHPLGAEPSVEKSLSLAQLR